MICDCDGWCDGQCLEDNVKDWSFITVQIRPLLVQLEHELNERKTEDAIITSRKIENLIDELLGYLYREVGISL